MEGNPYNFIIGNWCLVRCVVKTGYTCYIYTSIFLSGLGHFREEKKVYMWSSLTSALNVTPPW